MSVLTDEHVPRVSITTLRSNGYEIERARDVFGEATDDERLLGYCGENGHLLLTHDKKDFADDLGNTVDHAGIAVDTDGNWLRDDPEDAVRTLERILSYYSSDG